MMSNLKKCVVWDLDNTIWDGICLEGNIKPRAEVIKTIVELDDRGILHSIASRGEENIAIEALKRYDLFDYFLAPRINWLPKYSNIYSIADELGISVDSLVFIDDDVFELEQIKFMIPDVVTIEANKVSDLPLMSMLSLGTITRESKKRRQFYQAEIKRKHQEAAYPTREAFLKSCAMKLNVHPIYESDIPRALELMTRTHQLNTTGRIFNQNELNEIMNNKSAAMRIFVADLKDIFGSYGTIGVAIIEETGTVWRLIFLAISCRVMGRGIERAFLTKLIEQAKIEGLEYAEAIFRETGKNRMMRNLYQMMNFRRCGITELDQSQIFRLKTKNIPKSPQWVEVI